MFEELELHRILAGTGSFKGSDGSMGSSVYIYISADPLEPRGQGEARGEAVHGRDTKVRHELSPEVQANRGRSCMRCRGPGASVSQRFEGRVAHRGVVSPFWTRCRGSGIIVWMKHTSRGSGPSVFNGFEGRVRHTLASHSGPFWATSWA